MGDAVHTAHFAIGSGTKLAIEDAIELARLIGRIGAEPAQLPEVLKAYVANFGPRLIGLTGSPEEVAAIAKAYRAYYAKAGNGSTGTDYLMDHSSIIYLMGPDGRFVKHMPYTTDAAKLATELKETLKTNP